MGGVTTHGTHIVMAKPTQSFLLYDIFPDGPALLGPMLAIKAFAIVGIVLLSALTPALSSPRTGSPKRRTPSSS